MYGVNYTVATLDEQIEILHNKAKFLRLVNVTPPMPSLFTQTTEVIKNLTPLPLLMRQYMYVSDFDVFLKIHNNVLRKLWQPAKFAL